MTPEELRQVLCECGCGNPAPIAAKTNRKAGHVKGQPVRFIRGHVGATQRREPGTCSVVGCDRPRKGRELCSGHLKRVAKTGSTGGPLGIPPLIDRALSGAREQAAPDFLGPNSLPCWLVKPSTKDGRLRLHQGDRHVFAYRVTYEEFIGRIPDGLVPDHLCRRPACINPWHLDPVPDRVNVARGSGPTAVNARKEFCKNGHPLSGDNVRVETTGSRRCRTCLRIRNTATARKAVAS